MRLLFALMMVLSAFAAYPAFCEETNWPPESLNLLRQAQNQPEYARVASLSPSFYPTSDGRSFYLVWKSGPGEPEKWIVSLPGTHGYATKDLSLWAPLLKDRNVGLVDLQWWLGTGDTPRDYYTPTDIYREIDRALSTLHVVPGTAMLQGFSRGSSNIYAVAALDRSGGRKYFSLFVAHSGGATLEYPPTKSVDEGKFGKQPFAGSDWVTVCGARDPHPDRDGCPAMQHTAEWLRKLGGTVAFAIEDPDAGHGALMRNPRNAARLLDYYVKN